MYMSRPRQAGVLLESRKVGRHRISARNYRFELVISLLIGQHHAAQIEVPAFGKIARLASVVQAGLVRLPHFDQRVRQRTPAVRTVDLAGDDEPFAGFVWGSELGLE